ncbi:MAG: NADH-quinone oxidoreductase subunit D [Sandaracinaceae bacterium]|nr:NADH-quinone oxidoreductase subunit D [Sandaracinaceae bacterium]
MEVALRKIQRPDPYLDIADVEADAELMLLHLGPQHPSTHGVFRIDLYLDGEIIVKAVPFPGYLHRGVEKLCERLTFVQQTPVVDKHDYVAPMTSEQAINMAFEALLKVEVPRRARYLRSIFAEMQRIASHLLWLGTFTLDLGGAMGGGTTLFMHCFRERETILDLFEEVTGARFHYNTHTIGGNRHDLTAGWAAKVKSAMDLIESRLSEYVSMSYENRIFRQRTSGVGVLDGALALELGVSGPILRASGVDHDLRRDAPFHAYDEVEVKVATATEGDCLARTKVRVEELRESIRLVRLFLDGLPEGPINGGKPIKLAGQYKVNTGQVYVGIETPRGELGTYVIAGGEGGASPYRLKFRAPSLHALSTLPYVLPGATLSDCVAILGSLDPIMGEVDR